MKGLQLLATGGALPGRVVTNEDLSRQVDTSDEWITTRTGIRQRYYCTESEDAATLAIAAARQALARSGLAASEIACCVAATLSAPTATPSVACRVQAALGLPENRPAFDVNAACSGFIYAIAAAHGLLNTLGGRYALVIGCEAGAFCACTLATLMLSIPFAASATVQRKEIITGVFAGRSEMFSLHPLPS